MNISTIPISTLCGHHIIRDFPICEECLGRTLGHSLLEKAKKMAILNRPILIQGETGTGKTLLAEYIHNKSARSNGPIQKRGSGDFCNNTSGSVLFGAIQGAYTDARDRAGILEMLDGGTLILDDIDYMPAELQQSLLRFLDDGKFYRTGEPHHVRKANVRILATSNKNLHKLTQEGKFLPDLLARIGGFALHLPPLRERGDAVVHIAQFFLNEAARQNHCPPTFWTLSQDVEQLLMAQIWNRNVRELASLIQNITTLVSPNGGVLTAKDVSACLRDINPIDYPPFANERLPTIKSAYSHLALDERIYRTLSECNGNITLAARQIGCSRTTIYKYIRSRGWPV